MILITGGLGFIGSHTARAVVELGESCVLVQRRDVAEIPAILRSGRILVEQADLINLDSLIDVGKRHAITGIVHLAGSMPWPPGAYEPVDGARVALTSLLNVFEAAMRWDVPRVGIASTMGVYGGLAGEPPYGEDSLLPMTSPHVIPAFKKIGEMLGGYIAGTAGLEVLNYRIGAIWGPFGRPRSPFFGAAQLAHAAARGVPPDLSSLYSPPFAGNGIDLCYVRDCGRAIALLQLAGRLNHRTYNVASGRLTTYGEICEAIGKIVPDARMDLPPGRDPNGPEKDVYLDISRIRQDIGFQVEYDAERAVADYISWLRAGNER